MNTDLAHLIATYGWLPTIAVVFFWGLMMNATPCVYPMIPITISYFGGTAGEETSKRSGLLRAILFVAGMAITYSFLGVSAALTGRIFGASLGNPYVVGFVSAVMVLMALSMFGVFQMTAPSSWLSGIQETRDRLGWLGALFFGLVIGVVMAPCVGPFITALLVYVGAQHDPLLGFWLFFILAIGMGAPYVILGYYTAALKALPRPGTWMLWLEKFFGLVLIGYAYKLWMPFIPNDAVAYGILAMYLLVAAAVLGFVATPGARPGFRVFKLVAIVGVLALSGWAGLQVRHDLGAGMSSPSPGSAATPRAIAWQPYSDAALEKARAEGRPVMIDFYAKWCASCNELDEKTYVDPKVIAESERLLCLKADFTQIPDVDGNPTAKRFGIQGLPTVVFIDKKGTELKSLRVEDFIPADKMLAQMEKATQ
jgi:thiol:disulfide interchange protein DsbD